MYDLEVEICNNEGIEKFEDLGLGPLVRHTLALHYFSVNLDTSQVFNITSAEIIQHLFEFACACKFKDVQVEAFLDFIAQKRSVARKEELGIRIQSLGYVKDSFWLPFFYEQLFCTITYSFIFLV